MWSTEQKSDMWSTGEILTEKKFNVKFIIGVDVNKDVFLMGCDIKNTNVIKDLNDITGDLRYWFTSENDGNAIDGV